MPCFLNNISMTKKLKYGDLDCLDDIDAKELGNKYHKLRGRIAKKRHINKMNYKKEY